MVNGALPAGLAMLPALLSACSWSRFDELQREAPVVLIDRPYDLAFGFGFGLATVSSDEQSRLLVSGPERARGAASYDVGWEARPQVDPLDTGHCTPKDRCFLAARPAALERAPGEPEARRCFTSGVASKGESTGILLRCETAQGTYEHVLDLPERLEAPAAALIESGDGVDLALTADAASSLLVAIWPGEAVFYYLPGSELPRELALPNGLDPASLSGGASVLATRDGYVLALGTTSAEVWFFRITEHAADPTGCLAGPPGFGRAIASGRVDGDEDDELVVSDDGYVSVLSGATLAELPATPSPKCGLSVLPSRAVLATFGCGEVPATGGCEESGFGAALAVGDLDGDEDGEVAVGAPDTAVRGESGAGAVLLYDVEPGRAEPADVLFLSSADRNDALGHSLATPRLADRQVIAAGMPGAGQVALFLCNALLSPGGAAGGCR